MNTILHDTRGGVIENSHPGHIAVVDINGRLLFSFGDPLRPTYGRSALKLMQVLPVIETGAAERYHFSDADLVLCAASHSGEEQHRAHVTSMLRRIGRTEGDLHCGAKEPESKQSYEKLIRNGHRAGPICNGCSGVHVGMLATAIHMNEDLSNYTSIEHPVQQRAFKAVSNVTAMPQSGIHVAVDGCGIPTYRIPLVNIAWGFARLANPRQLAAERQNSIGRIVSAFVNRPEMATGKILYSTKLIKAFNGRMVGKEGAQGVFGLCDRDLEIGIAIKIEDGSADPLPPVVNEVLRQLGIGTDGPLDALQAYANEDIKNAPGQIVGRREPAFTLQPNHKSGR